ncbi:RHS repeat domain-containing protein, partial [Escherichia coli]|uniref:RHS repeat domain-containing protein n=1 Tax=Escherichia coli TaxID=562 RepID=UPI0015605A1A
REVLHTQGEAGLKRVVKKEHADGSVTQSQFDAVGRLKAQTDATGSRKTMTWSRYGQLLTFTDCSGYVTRYDHDRFGQVTAVH